jgi:hypothetical protein
MGCAAALRTAPCTWRPLFRGASCSGQQGRLRKQPRSGAGARMAFRRLVAQCPHASEQRQIPVAMSGVRLPGIRNPGSLDRGRRRPVCAVPCRDRPSGRVSDRSGDPNPRSSGSVGSTGHKPRWAEHSVFDTAQLRTAKSGPAVHPRSNLWSRAMSGQMGVPAALSGPPPRWSHPAWGARPSPPSEVRLWRLNSGGSSEGIGTQELISAVGTSRQGGLPVAATVYRPR